jgi:hypothetical protein
MVESQVAICTNLTALTSRRLMLVLGKHRYSSHRNQSCQEEFQTGKSFGNSRIAFGHVERADLCAQGTGMLEPLNPSCAA